MSKWISDPLIETLRRIWKARPYLGGRGRLGAIETRLSRLEERVDLGQREARLLLSRILLPSPDLFPVPPSSTALEAGRNVLPCSSVCRQESFEQPYFAYWIQRMAGHPRYHRKQWELVYIVQSLWERDVLKPGARGLGFGVGEEPLSALFASLDCRVLATDMRPDKANSAGWIQSEEHAASKDSLRHPKICDDEQFLRNVAFQVCDMNNISPDLTDFDFCWSACAFEHLGSIAAGLAFVENSLACLRPGGWAVHTTEFNMSSNEETVDHESTVLFRKRDFEILAERLRAQGHFVAPLDFMPGELPMDRYVDTPPFRTEPHLVLALKGYATTSFGVLVRKAG